MSEKKNEYLMFKGKPLIRDGNIIYYGNASDEYVIVFQIVTSEEVNGVKIAKKISVQLYSTDSSLKMNERILNRTDKVGFYSAMDIADIWLERARAKKVTKS